MTWLEERVGRLRSAIFGGLVLCLIKADFTQIIILSIFRDLQDLHSFAPLQIQNLQIFSVWGGKKSQNVGVLQVFVEISHFRSDFDENLSEFHDFFKIMNSQNVGILQIFVEIHSNN